VAVNHEVRLVRSFGLSGFGNDDGMAGGGAQARVEADVPAMVHEPAGAGAQILLCCGCAETLGKRR